MLNRNLYFFLLIFVFLSYCIEASKTYYQILDVPKDAPKRQIEKQFRKLGKLYHPDNPKTGDEAKYVELTEAYETLIDDDKRAHYDRFGKTDNRRGGGQPQGAQFFTGGFPGGGRGFPFGGFGFGGFPGGGGGRGGSGKQCTKTTQCVNGKCTTTEICY